MGFEPTYEELKQPHLSYIFCYNTRFWAYLWGIETIQNIIDPVWETVFWAYLWGIETK